MTTQQLEALKRQADAQRDAAAHPKTQTAQAWTNEDLQF